MPTTTPPPPPWERDPGPGRLLLHVPRRWPVTTIYVIAVAALFIFLCISDGAR
jgi:hypothetical protein